MKISFVTPWCRRLVSVGASALMLAALGVMPAHAISTEGLFELDGNVADPSGPALPDDWASFYVVPSQGHSRATSGIVADTLGPVFRGSKDTENISSWRYATGASPPKADLEHAYAAAYTATATAGNTTMGDLLVYFGANREAFNGTTSLGFWFFKNPIKAENGRFINPNTNAPAVHAEGDVLVAFEYKNGGAVLGVRLFKWTSGQLVEKGAIGTPTATTNASVYCNNDDSICGANNHIAIDMAWAPNDPPGPSQPGRFFEGGINLSRIFQGGDTCFTGFMATTRSSTEPGATIKNFILGNFPVCRLTVTKSCESSVFQAANNTVLNTVVGSVLNDGGAQLSNITLSDNKTFTALAFLKCNGAVPAVPAVSQDPGTLAVNASICYRGTYTSDTLTTSDTVTASASTGSGTVTGTATSSCTAPLTVGLVVDKTCNVTLDTQGSLLAVKVNYEGKVTNNSDVALTGVTVCEAAEVGTGDDPCTVVGSVSISVGNIPAHSYKTYSGFYHPKSALNAQGSSTTVPDAAVFKDKVRAYGTLPAIAIPVGGNSTIDSPATEAMCPLCN